MVNAKEFYSGNFLKAESCKGGELCEIMNAGTMEEITVDNQAKSILNFEIKYDIEGINNEKTFSPNKSNGNIFCSAWGEDTEAWVGKRFTIGLGKVNVFGKFKNSIIVEPITPTE